MAGLEAHSSQREDKQDEFECVKILGNLAGFIIALGCLSQQPKSGNFSTALCVCLSKIVMIFYHLARPRLELDLKKDLKDIWGFEISKNQGGSATTLNIYIYSLLRTFYGKYLEFVSNKGISKQIADFLRLGIPDCSRGELDYSHSENQISQSENGWVIF